MPKYLESIGKNGTTRMRHVNVKISCCIECPYVRYENDDSGGERYDCTLQPNSKRKIIQGLMEHVERKGEKDFSFGIPDWCSLPHLTEVDEIKYKMGYEFKPNSNSNP